MKKLLVGVIALLLISCSNVTETKTENVNQQLLNFLASDGFDTKDAIIENNQIVIEGDIAIDIDDLKMRYKQSKDSRDKQWRTRYLISQSRARYIKVKFASNLSYAWKQSGRQAMSKLNNVSGSKIRLVEVSSGQDILVKRGNVGSARGTFPSSSGRAGHTIWIGNISPTGYYSNTMLHELGHNIGLRHDHAPREGISSWQRISGTPYSDTYSVMSYNRSRYFTYYDKKAIRTLYPN